LEQISRYVKARTDGVSFGELFAKIRNSSPARAEIHRPAIERLREECVGVAKSEKNATQRAPA